MAQVGLLEDNSRIAKLCATILHHAGHQVTIYEHPLECLRALLQPNIVCGDGIATRRTLPSAFLPIEVLILDLQLPDIDGVEVSQYLRSNPRTQGLPIIFCTAAHASEIARAQHFAPYATFVEKPFKIPVLTTAITKALNNQGI
jgi:CheY-like chemotaxis protein